MQHRVVQDGHIKSLVDSLDPNHDPVSLPSLFISINFSPIVILLCNKRREKLLMLLIVVDAFL